MEKVVFNTDGSGYWSREAKAVEITDMKLGYLDEEAEYGELRVYFNTKTWDVNKDGLIYTDGLFKQELMRFIEAHGLVVDLCYSEQGMQGDDYVSLDVGADFLASWSKKFGVDLQDVVKEQQAAIDAYFG
jgi:hypothetical protein